MPSVEYLPETLVWDTEEHCEYTDPDTGETTTYDVEAEQRPFEVRISKWLERSDGYHVHGFVEVTEFGQALATQSDPYAWVNDTHSIADGLTEQDMSEIINRVAAVENAQLDAILDFGNASWSSGPSSNPLEAKLTVTGQDIQDAGGTLPVTLSRTESYKSSGASTRMGADPYTDATLEAPADEVVITHQIEVPTQ